MNLSEEQFDYISDYKERLIEHADVFTPPLEQFEQKDFRLRDLMLPPTLVTAAGLALVLDGCRDIDTMSGVNKIVAGRVGGDLLDGGLARLLNMTTDAGAFADTAADKLGMLAIASAAWRKEAIPKHVISTVIAKHTISVGLTAAMAIRHPDASFRPSRTGKYAMAADNVAFIGLLYGNALERELPELNLHEGARNIGRIAVSAGNALSVPTTIEYTHRALTR